MKRRSLLFWSALIALLLWRVPYLSAEESSEDSSRVLHYGDMIVATALREGVDPALVEAIVAVESAYNPWAISSRGAKGLMQLMPETASRYGVSNPFDPQENLTGGIRYLRDLLRRFDGDLTQTLAAYNAGEAAVSRYQGLPPFRETVEYVRKVLARYQSAQVLASIGRLESKVAQVREEARELVKQKDATPASSRISSASTTRLKRAAARRPLTEMSRAPLVRTKKGRAVSVKLRVHRYR